MADKTWKQTERAIAKRLNGQRLGASGRAAADIQTDWLSVEVKHRKRLPQWLKDAWAQAANGAENRLPLVVLHECGSRRHNDLVVLRLGDFEDWFGKVEVCHGTGQSG